MKKNTTFHNLFQKIVSEEKIAIIQDTTCYKDSARKLNVLTLIKYLLCAAMNEFKSYRNCADVGDQYGLPKVDHSTLSKKVDHVNFNIMKVPRLQWERHVSLGHFIMGSVRRNRLAYYPQGFI